MYGRDHHSIVKQVSFNLKKAVIIRNSINVFTIQHIKKLKREWVNWKAEVNKLLIIEQKNKNGKYEKRRGKEKITRRSSIYPI